VFVFNDLNFTLLYIQIFSVGCTKSEPDPGWLENMNGPSAIVAGVMTGFLRTVPIVRNKITDIVPADYTINALISVMWDTVNRYIIYYCNTYLLLSNSHNHEVVCWFKILSPSHCKYLILMIIFKFQISKL